MKQATFVGCALVLAIGVWSLMASAAPRCYPTIRFVAIDGGLVRDTLTGLVWQQPTDTEGRIWADAKSHCQSVETGFRLPTIKELRSLVDLSAVSGPKINQTAFPGVKEHYYWTSSPRPGTTNMWAVSFIYGETTASPMSSPLRVICVR